MQLTTDTPKEVKERFEGFNNLLYERSQSFSDSIFINLSLLLLSADIDLDQGYFGSSDVDSTGNLTDDGYDVVSDISFIIEVTIVVCFQ